MASKIGSSIRAGRLHGAARRPIPASVLAGLALLGCLGGCAGSVRYPVAADVPDELTSNQELNQDLALMAAQAAANGDYRIGPEDLLELTLFDIQDRDGEPRIVQARVSNTGYTTLPLIGNAAAAGLTPMELEEELRGAYSKFIHQPQLTVFVREFRSYPVSIIGYVDSPGIVELRGRKTVFEALAMAGGLTDEASKQVRLTRTTLEGTQTVLVDLDQIADQGELTMNVDVLPGDVITVPKAGTFYVEGIVNKPGAYPLLQETTVSQAIATAGGPDLAYAKTSGTKLYRKTAEGERVVIPINLAALQKGKEEDLLIMQDDVIVVPMSVPRLWIDRLTRGVLRVGLNAPLL